MVTTIISPLPIQHFVDNNGNALTGGKLFCYAAGTTTKQTTYTDQTGGTPNPNPVILNSRGEAQVWFDATKSYKLVLAPSTDSDPPTNAFWTVDNLNANLGGASGFGAQASLVSSATTDLGTVTSNDVLVTGSTTITSFGASATTTAPIFLVEFNGILTLTYNATSLILPGAANIKTAQGDTSLCLYLGSGNWRVLTYQRANGQPISITGIDTTLASAATTDLGSTGVNLITVSGVTTITSFGTSASTSNPLYFVKFSGALTITYNAVSLITPTAANIMTAANSSIVAEYLGGGNWQVLQVQNASGGGAGGGSTGTPMGGTFRNLKITSAGGTKQATITADAVVMATANDVTSIIGESLNSTLDISTNGAVNKLDAGTAANSTLYFIFAISNGTTNGVLASLSSTAPTLPSGYIYKARIGAFFTDGSANIKAGNQLGRNYRYSQSVNLASGTSGTYNVTTPAWASVSLTGFVPTTAAKYTVTLENHITGQSSANVLVAPNANYGGPEVVVGATAPCPLALDPSAGNAIISGEFVYEAATVQWVSNTAGGALWCAGWEDNL